MATTPSDLYPTLTTTSRLLIEITVPSTTSLSLMAFKVLSYTSSKSFFDWALMMSPFSYASQSKSSLLTTGAGSTTVDGASSITSGAASTTTSGAASSITSGAASSTTSGVASTTASGVTSSVVSVAATASSTTSVLRV